MARDDGASHCGNPSSVFFNKESLSQTVSLPAFQSFHCFSTEGFSRIQSFQHISPTPSRFNWVIVIIQWAFYANAAAFCVWIGTNPSIFGAFNRLRSNWSEDLESNLFGKMRKSQMKASVIYFISANKGNQLVSYGFLLVIANGQCE